MRTPRSRMSPWMARRGTTWSRRSANTSRSQSPRRRESLTGAPREPSSSKSGAWSPMKTFPVAPSCPWGLCVAAARSGFTGGGDLGFSWDWVVAATISKMSTASGGDRFMAHLLHVLGLRPAFLPEPPGGGLPVDLHITSVRPRRGEARVLDHVAQLAQIPARRSGRDRAAGCHQPAVASGLLERGPEFLERPRGLGVLERPLLGDAPHD